MIHSISKPINQIQRVLINHFVKIQGHSKHYHSFGAKKQKAKTKHENPKKTTQNRRPKRPTPFVAAMKEIHDPDEALSLFHEYYQMGYKLDYPSFSSLIYKLAKSRNFEAVETLLGILQNLNIHCKETLFCALFQLYGKAHLTGKAVELFRKMPSFNCVCTVQSLNSVLNVLVDNNWFSDAKGIFDKSKEMGLRPNSVTFNVLIKGLLKRAEFNELKSLLSEMKKRRFKPDVVICNILVNHLCKESKVEEAYKVLTEMQVKGCEPNAATYRMMVDGFCMVGDFGGALKVLNVMLKSIHCLRSETFCRLAAGLLNCGKIDGACFVLEEMVEKNEP